jgi:hypothetical protein
MNSVGVGNRRRRVLSLTMQRLLPTHQFFGFKVCCHAQKCRAGLLRRAPYAAPINRFFDIVVRNNPVIAKPHMLVRPRVVGATARDADHYDVLKFWK